MYYTQNTTSYSSCIGSPTLSTLDTSIGGVPYQHKRYRMQSSHLKRSEARLLIQVHNRGTSKLALLCSSTPQAAQADSCTMVSLT
jgi:hypothetical protein